MHVVWWYDKKQRRMIRVIGMWSISKAESCRCDRSCNRISCIKLSVVSTFFPFRLRSSILRCHLQSSSLVLCVIPWLLLLFFLSLALVMSMSLYFMTRCESLWIKQMTCFVYLQFSFWVTQQCVVVELCIGTLATTVLSIGTLTVHHRVGIGTEITCF